MEPNNVHTMEPNNVHHKIETLLDDDEDENAPAAEDVDAFAAVLKGDLGDAAGHGAAAAAAITRSSSGTMQPLPQSPATSVSSGQTVGQPVSGQTVSGQPVSGQPVNGQPVSGQVVSGQPVNGQPVGGQTVSGQSAAGHTVGVHTGGGHPVSGQMGSKAVALGPGPVGQQQQLLWSQLSPEQQREMFQRRAIQQQQQQQRLQQQQKFQQLPQHQFQQLQQSQQTQHQPQQQESGSTSSVSGNRKTMLREGISFTALMPLLQPHLPPEQGQQLSVLYHKFKRNEITREDFIRGARVIAGDQVLVQTIRQMHVKQQAQLQQQQLLQQKLQLQQLQQHQQPPPQQLQQHQSQLQSQQQPQPQQQSQQQPQPHLQLQSSHVQDAQQQLPQNPVASSGTPSVTEASTQQQQQQQLSQEPISAAQQTLPTQMPQPLVQTQEPTATNAAKPKLPLGHTQAHPFQQAQVPSNVDHSTLPQGPQPQSHLPSSLPSTQAQSMSVKQGDQLQDSGQGQLPNLNSVTPMVSMQVKHEVDKSLSSFQPAKQQLPSVTFPSMQSLAPTSTAHQLQTTMMAAAVPQSQPYMQTGLPQQPIPGQVPVHLQLPQAQTQPGAQAPGAVGLSQPPAQLQPQPEKPLTKYAKQKLRKEQKRREEEEKRKQMEEENLKKAQATPSGVVPTVHQGLHPQLPTPQLSSPPIEISKQSYSHHPGSLSQQVQLQTPVPHVDKQKVVPIAPGGLVTAGQGQPLVPVKQEPPDVQSEQKRQSFQFLSDGQAGQKPVGQTQVTDASVLPANNLSHVPVQGSNSEQVQTLTRQGSMTLTSPSTTPNLSQQAGMASMPAPGVVQSSVLGGSSGLHSTLPIKQVVGQQRAGQPPTTTAFNTTSLLPVTSFNSATPIAIGPVAVHNIQPAPNLVTTPANKTPTKKPAVGIKKTADSILAQQPPSKKQKMSAGEPDQSIDQLNDVTAVSGVNLKEEEEQLLAGPKEEGRTTEAMRKIVQEEEERLFLERGPLRSKVTEIATRCGIKSVSEDVGRCLSMSVEERLRSMLYKLVKLSKQRCDVEKDRHKVIGTTDIRRQILLLKKKAKEMLDKKLAEESDRLRKLNEKKDKGSLPEVEREELKAKAQKAQQEEEDRMKANAANVAARAAVGADDMLLKWQMMAEQGRQKRQGEAGAGEENAANRAGSSVEGGAAMNSDKKLENGDSAAVGRGSVEAESQGTPSASATGRPPGSGSGVSRMISGRRALKSARGERVITVRDVIAFLETESQMSKSTLLYRLYERERRDGEKKGLGGSRK